MEHKYENIWGEPEKISSKIMLFSFVDIWQMTAQKTPASSNLRWHLMYSQCRKSWIFLKFNPFIAEVLAPSR